MRAVFMFVAMACVVGGCSLDWSDPGAAAGGSASGGDGGAGGALGGAGGEVQRAVCGNGIIEAGEECDDQNDLVDDFCHACLVVCEGEGRVKNPINHHCYGRTPTAGTWDDVEALCVSLGAHLAAITGPDELGVVSTIVSGDVWLGGRNPGDGWSWVNGESFTYNEPFAPDQLTRVGCMLIADDDMFYSEPCDTGPFHGICEIPPAGTRPD